jgi:hypothetical protein
MRFGVGSSFDAVKGVGKFFCVCSKLVMRYLSLTKYPLVTQGNSCVLFGSSR